MNVSYAQKQKNRIEEFGFDWFTHNQKDEYGNKIYPRKFNSVEDAKKYKKDCGHNSFGQPFVSIIDGPGFAIIIGNIGTAKIEGFYLEPGYNRTKVFRRYNKYMAAACGQELLR